MAQALQQPPPELIGLLKTALAHQEKEEFDHAEKAFKTAIKKYPGFADVFHLSGIFYVQIGKHKYAINLLKKIIKEKANDPKLQRLIGQAYYEDEDYPKAQYHLKKATELNPKDLLALRYYGLTCHKIGDIDSAEKYYYQTLELEDHISTYNRLAEILLLRGQYEKARSMLQDAVNKDCFNQNTLLYLSMAHHEGTLKSLENLILAYRMNPDNETVITMIAVNCFAGIQPDGQSNELRNLLMTCFKTNKVTHLDLKHIWQNQVFKCVGAEELEEVLALGTYEDFALEKFTQYIHDDLLIEGIKKITAYNRPLEKFLTYARRTYLDIICAQTRSLEDKERYFLSALNSQSYMNEYVFFISHEENKKLSNLKAKIENTDSFEAIQNEILIYCCYEPLNTLNNYGQIAAKLEDSVLFKTPINEQVTQIKTQKKLKKKIKSLNKIKDQTSKKVQEQYEENPYPRWIGANHMEPLLTRGIAKDYFKKGKILIAGCGTGRHIVFTKNLYPHFDMLAVDLSKSSIAYAMMKAEELSLKNLRFLHGDILDLKSLNEEFDLIESMGVIHHMKDPEAGLRSLLSLLKPSGELCLGLYSELARKNVVQAGEIIKEKGFKSTPEDIRQCREYIFEETPLEEFSFLKKTTDFYTTSTCRDLIFHVQEKRYTIPEIKSLLERNNLIFDKFILPHPKIQQFQESYPDKESLQDLDKWHKFEEKNPDFFSAMYQFVCTKK